MDREIRPFDLPSDDLEQEAIQDRANHLISTYYGLTDSILMAYQHTWWSLFAGTGLSLLVVSVGILNGLDQSVALIVVGSIVGCFLVSLIVTTIIVRIRLNILDSLYEKGLLQL